MKTQLYKISQKFAQVKNLPVYFEAVQLTETNKAVYLYGHGTTKTKEKGICCACGRELTHPVSVELGIGPECGKHYWDWDAVGGYSKENIARLTKAIKEEIRVDCWLPKSVTKVVAEDVGNIQPPKNHKMLKRTKSKKTKIRKAVPMAGDKIKILFPFDRQLIRNIKTIPGRKYHDEKIKYWSAPLSVQAIEKLKEYGFKIHDDLIQFYRENKIDYNNLDTDIEIPGLNGELYPFQKEGVAFLDARDGNALIADEMGLGKTVQTVAWLQKHPEYRPALIVVPASLKDNWEKEARFFMSDPDVQILNGQTPYPITGDIIIINYDILQYWADAILEYGPLEFMAMDEIHYIKNSKAKRTKAAKKIAKKSKRVTGLSGTPIVNRPVEAVNAIQVIDDSVIPNRWHFLHRYCDAKNNGFGWDFSGASNTQELHQKLTSTIMLRRKKKDVLKDLPDKTRSFIPMELNNQAEYQAAEDDFINYVKQKTQADLEKELEEKLGSDLFSKIQMDEEKLEQLKREKVNKVTAAETLVKIGAMKQLAAQGKMNHAVEWIRNFLHSGEKLVVMATHKFVINRLMEEFGEIAVKIDGSVPTNERGKVVERFQSDRKTRLFIGNMKAAGIGLTLTAASSMAFLELPWTPGDLSQAEDRIHRIGQENDACNYYYLLAKDTIDEKNAKLLDQKIKVLDAVLDGKETNNESLLSELIKSYQ